MAIQTKEPKMQQVAKQQRMLYTENDITRAFETFADNAELLPAVRELMNKLVWGFNERVLSSTFFEGNDLYLLWLYIQRLRYHILMFTADWDDNTERLSMLENLETYIMTLARRSKGGWFTNRFTVGMRTAGIEETTAHQPERKKRWGIF
jgi:hypothetical protein